MGTAEDVPKVYKRLVARSTGPDFRSVAEIQDHHTERPGNGEVLVKLTYAGINGGCETFRVRGEYSFTGNKWKKNFKLGAEAAGIIAAVGPDVEGLKVGQHVTVLGGGYEEFALSKAAGCYPVREASAEAVAVTLSGLTAAGALLYKGGIKGGETVLVTAAAGGTGHFAVQIAKLKGCKVIATAGSAEKADKLREIGADRVINYREEDVGAVLASEYKGQIDVAYEGVGGPLRDAVLANLAPGGRVLAVGYISEYPHTAGSSPDGRTTSNGSASSSGHDWKLPPADQLMWEAKTIKNGDKTFYGQVWPEDRQLITDAKNWLFEQYYAGKIKAWVDPKPFKGLDSVADAIEYMLSGKSIGKVVVDLH